MYFCTCKFEVQSRSLNDALVVELVDTRDLKSLAHCERAGSSPARGTKKAEVAQLVEHDLAKVGVASSSLVHRSMQDLFLHFCSNNN